MMFGRAILLCVAAFVSMCQGYSYFYNFDINSIVQCVKITSNYVLIPDDPQFLAIQPGRPGEVWKPAPGPYGNSYYFPFHLLRYLDYSALGRHLGDDYDPQKTSIRTPTDPVPAPDQVARVQVPNSLFSEGVNSSIANTVRTWAQNNLFCLRGSNWTDLGHLFFPRWILGKYCTDPDSGQCSIPTCSDCQKCHPDLRNLDYVTLLHWDCCFVALPGSQQHYNWACGWRKVHAPILKDCICACNPVFPAFP